MKKFLIVLFVIMGIFLFSGCNNSEEAQHPLAIYKGNNLVAEIGMAKEDVDKNLGEGEATPEPALFLYKGISVIYRNNTVCSIEVKDPAYSDYKNIKVGMTFNQAKHKYQDGETVLGSDDYALEVGFDAEKQIINNPVEEGQNLYNNSDVSFMKYYQKADKKTMQNSNEKTGLNTTENHPTISPDSSKTANNTSVSSEPGDQKIAKIIIYDIDAANGKY